MSLPVKSGFWPVIIIPLVIAAIAIAWSGTGTSNDPAYHYKQDTIPVKKNHRARQENNINDLDREIEKLDQAMEEVDKLPQHIDWKKIEAEVKSAMKKANAEIDNTHFDTEKMEKEIEASMKKIDVEKIEKETRLAMQQAAENIDFKQIAKELEHSLAEAKTQLNSEEIRKSLEQLKKVDMEKILQDLERAREDLVKNKVDIREEMERAKEDIKKARETLTGYRQMLDDMEKNGLVDTKKDYSIEYKNGNLYIDDWKQPADVTDKYKGYFRKDNTKIYKKQGRFNINIE